MENMVTLVGEKRMVLAAKAELELRVEALKEERWTELRYRLDPRLHPVLRGKDNCHLRAIQEDTQALLLSRISRMSLVLNQIFFAGDHLLPQGGKSGDGANFDPREAEKCSSGGRQAATIEASDQAHQAVHPQTPPQTHHRQRWLQTQGTLRPGSTYPPGLVAATKARVEADGAVKFDVPSVESGSEEVLIFGLERHLPQAVRALHITVAQLEETLCRAAVSYSSFTYLNGSNLEGKFRSPVLRNCTGSSLDELVKKSEKCGPTIPPSSSTSLSQAEATRCCCLLPNEVTRPEV